MKNLLADEAHAAVQLIEDGFAVDYGDDAVDLHGVFLGGIGDGDGDIGDVGKAGGFDEDAAWGVLFGDGHEARCEGALEGTADTAPGHFGNVDVVPFDETAVHADGTEFIFQHGDFFAEVSFFEEFVDEGGFSRAEKSGDHVNFDGLCHGITSLCFFIISAFCRHFLLYSDNSSE